MIPTPIETRVFFRSEAGCPLGRLSMAGTLHHDGAGPRKPMRVFGSYAIVYILEGGGEYRDANHYRQRVRAGDLILIVPELAHVYGPRGNEKWSEVYAVFDGPAFDCWRAAGLFDIDRPIRRAEPVERWGSALLELLSADRPATMSERNLEVARFLELLTALLNEGSSESDEPRDEPWLARARTMLESNLERPMRLSQVAREAGMAEQTFRKRFQGEIGVSPKRYRTLRRVEAARAMLQQGRFSNKEIAASLGYTDAFHFSKQFHHYTGVSPRGYLRGLQRGD